jgi:hypothetical protein
MTSGDVLIAEAFLSIISYPLESMLIPYQVLMGIEEI